MSLLEEIREHYLAQLADFITRQQAECEQGSAEVKLVLSPESRVFRHLYCADFVRNGAKREVVEFSPETVLQLDPATAIVGQAEVTIEAMGWDDVALSHDLGSIPDEELSSWFDRWFDPDDLRHVPGSALSEVIHSVIVEEGRVIVDFGSAPVEAFIELLEVLSDAGATRIVITGARAD